MSVAESLFRSDFALNNRRHRRHHVKNVTWAMLKSGAAAITAQVMDIGIGGLSIHSASRLRISKAGGRLDLVTSRNGFHIKRIPFQTISGCTIPPQIPFGPEKWRYGLKFGKLTREQHAKLEAFIAKHTLRHVTGSG